MVFIASFVNEPEGFERVGSYSYTLRLHFRKGTRRGPL